MIYRRRYLWEGILTICSTRKVLLDTKKGIQFFLQLHELWRRLKKNMGATEIVGKTRLNVGWEYSCCEYKVSIFAWNPSKAFYIFAKCEISRSFVVFDKNTGKFFAHSYFETFFTKKHVTHYVFANIIKTFTEQILSRISAKNSLFYMLLTIFPFFWTRESQHLLIFANIFAIFVSNCMKLLKFFA